MSDEIKPPCAGKGQLMYPPVNDRKDGPSGTINDRATLPARVMCATCYRTAECLEDAYNNKERFGIWGGVHFGHKRERKQFFDDVNKKGISFQAIANRTKRIIESKAS